MYFSLIGFGVKIPSPGDVADNRGFGTFPFNFVSNFR